MSKVINLMNTSLKYILFLLMSALIVCVFAQVIFRFVIEQPLAWSEELARFLLFWLTFLGAAYAMSLRAHISIDFFVNKLPRSFHKVSLVFSALISISFFYILVTEGYNFTMRTMGQLSSALEIPMGIVYAVIPISGVILIINIIHVTIKTLFDKGGDDK